MRKLSFTEQIAKAYQLKKKSMVLANLLNKTEDRMGVVYIPETLITELVEYSTMLLGYIDIVQKVKGETNE